MAFFMLFSCGRKVYYVPDTEIACSNNYVYIVKFAKKIDVEKALRNAYITKKLEKTSEQYTVVRFDDKRSVKLDRLPPEESVNCILRETEYQYVDAAYIYGD